MNVELTKNDFINLVKSTQPNSATTCDKFASVGFMDFTGNQHNEAWEWNEKSLQTLSENNLLDLYLMIRKSRAEHADLQFPIGIPAIDLKINERAAASRAKKERIDKLRQLYGKPKNSLFQ
jgi:hypothetical protein